MHLFKILKMAKWPKVIITIVVIVSIISSIVALTLPLLTRNLIDQLTTGQIEKGYLGLVIGVFIFNGLISGISLYLIRYIGSKVMFEIREKMLSKIVYLPISYFDNNNTGVLISRLTDDIETINSFVTEKLTNLLSQILILIGSLIMLFILDWKLSLVILAVIPVVLFIILPIGNLTYKVAMESQDSMAQFTTTLNRSFSEMRLVKSYTAEESELNEGRFSLKKIFNLSIKQAKIQAFVSPIVSSALIVLLFSVIGYGVFRISNGTLTAGTFVAIIFYLVQAITPVSSITSFYTDLKKTQGSTKKLYELYIEPKEKIKEENNHTENLCLQNEVSSISIKDLSFSYNQGEEILKNISFEIPKNKVTAIVGPSGSGKSTLFYLIERMYEVNAGNIYYGNNDISQYHLKEWRSIIGYVMQENAMINGTIEENLTYGLSKKYTQEELDNASIMSNSKNFIDKLKNGYSTIIGERGVKLSGGQKQRIAIGRALLRQPKILLLDEATSSLDSESEKLVQEAIDNLIKNRTTIVIAHRLSTIKNAAQIVFLDNGEVTGIGTHSELMKHHKKYASFVNTQSIN
ncbi:ABC transporter ATP-binding protein [Rummeliibacillus suwonensis]|uniref:ABC transporter ATP-binding protein n=1 Tax=Rummeliibacillus suwonensis TaxID=1306154 RepID=UPI002896A02E|nr:ABC transporter ATP-binding protein [Rummeliibacillus suwonensis]